MGRKIPPANDGSNYYTARKGNRIEGVSFEDAILDEAADFSYARADHQHSVGDLFLNGGNLYTFTGGNNGGGLWTTIAATQNTTYTIPAYTTVPSVTISGNMAHWTIGNEIIGDLSMEERMLLQEQRTAIPDDHVFNPNMYGQCQECPHHNMYRNDPTSHLFVIQEPPSEQDWLDQLAS
jgi:hypothetical protein